MRRLINAARKSVQTMGGVIALTSICYGNYFVYSKAADFFYACDNRHEYYSDGGPYQGATKSRDRIVEEYVLAFIVASPILLTLGTLLGKVLGGIAASPFTLADIKLGKLEEKLNEGKSSQ